MARLVVAAGLALLAASARLSAQCCVDDPSGRDLRPAAEPLRVALVPGGARVALTWEATSGEYRVFQGGLAALHASGLLDDVEVATPTLPAATLAVPAGDTYWLVSARCHPLKCTRGRDSFGREREIPGCSHVEGGRLHYAEATCLLRTGSVGVVRDAAEHAAFAACFPDPSSAPPMQTGMAIAWTADEASAACGTCLQFTCVRVLADDVTLVFAGGPIGDCDALHAGGPWAWVPLRSRIGFEPADPLTPPPQWCP